MCVRAVIGKRLVPIPVMMILVVIHAVNAHVWAALAESAVMLMPTGANVHAT